MTGPAYQGNAPEPSRSLDLETGQITETPQAPLKTTEDVEPPNTPAAPAPAARSGKIGHDFDPEAAQFEPPAPPPMREGPPAAPTAAGSPPPAAPEQTAAIAELNSRMGEMINGMQKRDQEYRAREAARDLEHQMQIFELQQQQTSQPAGLESVLGGEPEENVTKADLARLLAEAGKQNALQQAQQIRATWNVTPQMETEIVTRYPRVAQMPEPQKTHLVQRYAQTLGAPAPTQTARPSPSDQARRAPTPTQPHQQTVPDVESGFRKPSTPDFQQEGDALTGARAEYERAQKIQDPKKRLAALREATDKILKAQGSSLEAFTQGGFIAKR